MQHIRNVHGGKVNITEEQEEAIGLTACKICEMVFVTTQMDAHMQAEHREDAEVFGEAEGGSDEGGYIDTPSEGDAQDADQQGGGGDGET